MKGILFFGLFDDIIIIISGVIIYMKGNKMGRGCAVCVSIPVCERRQDIIIKQVQTTLYQLYKNLVEDEPMMM